MPISDLDPQFRVRVQTADAFNHERLERVAMLYTPSRKLRAKHEARRHASKQCKACYYLRPPVLAMQAFCSYTCPCCEQERQHHNSAVPKYCPACCSIFELCGTCGGSLS